MSKLVGFLVVVALIAGAIWYAAGRAAGPTIDIAGPQSALGQTSNLSLVIDTPGGKLESLDVVLRQGATSTPVFTLDRADASRLVHDGPDRVRLTAPIGKHEFPQLAEGTAEILVTAARPVLFGLRAVRASASRQLQVRLNPPILAVVSTLHYINQGGSEMVIYRVTPADVASGVRVGKYEYPGFPASGAGIAHADPGLKIAFFALLWNQDPNTPISLYARDDVGNESTATFDYRVFPKRFRESRINIDDRFLAKVVPPILQNTPDFHVADPSNLLASFVSINRDLRRADTDKLIALERETSPQILWHGPFKQLVDSAVEAGFADQRTYVYKGEVIDKEVHLGYDLASIAGAPVHAANRGRVVHAGWLDIFGNCIVIDHGMGLMSLYGHLSSISVKVGDLVEEGAVIGHTGSTGLAGGDHLHFTMLLGGNAVTPVDWWSAKWVADRIDRKLREAAAATDVVPASSTPH